MILYLIHSSTQSRLLYQLIQLLNVEIQHFIGNALDVILLQLELYSQKGDVFLRQVDQLLQFCLDLMAAEVVTDKDAIVETIHNILLEVLLHGGLGTGYQT